MEQDIIQPIEGNLWWVIPGKLAGVRKPTAEEIVELRAMGIGAIVSVTCMSRQTFLIAGCLQKGELHPA